LEHILCFSISFSFDATSGAEMTHFTYKLSEANLTVESMLMSLYIVHLNNRIQI